MYKLKPRRTPLVWLLAMVLLPLLGGEVAAATGVRAEAWVSEARPFIHQSIIYTVRVYHGAVNELNPESLNLPSVSLERLDGPPETTRTIDSQHLYSDFHYALTPMDPGPLHIPPLEIKVVPTESTDRYGRITGGYSAEYSIRTGPVNLDVQPAAVAGQSWLPLYDLQIRAELEPGPAARVGEPISLTFSLQSWGGGGEQLPSLERLLESPDFKVYTEQSEVLTEIHDSGDYLLGVRQETFTLIPTREGRLSIPPLVVEWWDLRRGQMNSARWDGLAVPVGPGTRVGADGATAANGGDFSTLWIVLLVLLVAAVSFFMGWWLSVGRPGWSALLNRPRPQTTAEDVANGGATGQTMVAPRPRAVGRLGSWVDALGNRLPAVTGILLLVPLRRRFGERLRALEPRWMALWRLRGQMHKTNDPKQLETLMQRYAALQLGLKENASLVEIGDNIQRLYPKLTGTTARELLQRLDAGLYGGESDDPALQRCSKDLCCVLRTMGLRCPPGKNKHERAKLPDLNPGQ